MDSRERVAGAAVDHIVYIGRVDLSRFICAFSCVCVGGGGSKVCACVCVCVCVCLCVRVKKSCH